MAGSCTVALTLRPYLKIVCCEVTIRGYYKDYEGYRAVRMASEVTLQKQPQSMGCETESSSKAFHIQAACQPLTNSPYGSPYSKHVTL